MTGTLCLLTDSKAQTEEKVHNYHCINTTLIIPLKISHHGNLANNGTNTASFFVRFSSGWLSILNVTSHTQELCLSKTEKLNWCMTKENDMPNNELVSDIPNALKIA